MTDVAENAPRARLQFSEFHVVDLNFVSYLARASVSHRTIAKLIRIDLATFEKWRNEHPEFASALDPADESNKAVEQALLECALGRSSSFDETYTDASGRVTRVRARMARPPDLRAQRLLLANLARGTSTSPGRMIVLLDETDMMA